MTISKRLLFILIATLYVSIGLMAQSNLQRVENSRFNNNGFNGPALNNQRNDDEQQDSQRNVFGRHQGDEKQEKEVPIGIFQWTIDERFGDVIPAENKDTLINHFNNFNNTDGYNGASNYLGNIGSASMSRIYMDRNESLPFLFLRPFYFVLEPLSEFRFTNTLCPVTNLAYHSAGGSQNGEDRVRAYFASNINKISGIGFKVDYLYGRGYYNQQQSSFLNANFFGYYLGEKYQMHAWTQFGHQKNAESGGIENDLYITDPQSFPQSYNSRDIPVLLSGNYNRNDLQSFHLTHRYNLGYDEEIVLPDSLKPQIPSDDELLKGLNDSIRGVVKADSLLRLSTLDSLRNDWQAKQSVPTKFVQVGSIIHTLHIDNLTHRYYETDHSSKFYSSKYYTALGNIEDKTNGIRVKNTIGLSMKEGFRKWVKMGMTAFASYEYEGYNMPNLDADTISGMKRFSEHDFRVGGKIEKTEGSFLHYNVNGDISLLGTHKGTFDINGTADLNFPITKRDTVQLAANAFIKNLSPDPYMKHYHSHYAWWDNEELKFEERVRAEGVLTNKGTKTSLRFGIENITDHLYFTANNTYVGKPENMDNANAGDFNHDVRVAQHAGNIQVMSLGLKQDFSFGPLNWENEITYQHTSNEDVLPLPALNVYTNLYLLFKIAKVLRVELGADMRYFTKYYAPDYSPAISQFVTQDANHPRVSIGNYPIINAYANLHIKHCRIYIAANHVNAGNGRMFLAPHYPINPMSIHWGVSWNFFN